MFLYNMTSNLRTVFLHMRNSNNAEAQMTQAESVQAASDAHDAGVSVFVISVGNDISDAHLQVVVGGI